jgi:hypothetical protein
MTMERMLTVRSEANQQQHNPVTHMKDSMIKQENPCQLMPYFKMTRFAALALVIGLTASAAYGHSMLYAPSENDDPAFRTAVSALIGGPVDYFDARVGTPSLSLLHNYDCVHTWVNYAYNDKVAFGNNLADYADAGGRVILGVFSTYTLGNSLSGRIMNPGYSPVFSPGGNNHFTSSAYAGDGTLFHSGVTTYSIGFRDILAIQGGGLIDAHYLDGEIAVAYRPDLGVIYVNGSGASQLSPSGDWNQLLANTCLVQVPEPGSLTLAAFGLAAFTARRWRGRRAR